MMLQRLATGATGVKQARYRRRPTRGSEALARACAVYTHNASVLCMCVAADLHMNSAEGFALQCYSFYLQRDVIGLGLFGQIWTRRVVGKKR